MNAIALPRMELVPTLDIPSLKELAERAQNMMGYTHLTTSLADMRTLSILREMDWMPFVPANVVTYKTAKLKEAAGLNYFNPFRKLKWHWCEIANYRMPIPADVLDKGSMLKHRMGKESLRCEFRIAYMGTVDYDNERRKELALLDPFLILTRNGVSYHIEVWDEPTFNPKRQK